MKYAAHTFVFVLLAGLLWLVVFDLVFGQPLHVAGGLLPQDTHCGTHTPHTRLDECDTDGLHDHDMDGVHDDPRNPHFHEQDAAHHHQTGNVHSHPGEFDASNPHHRNQLNYDEL